MLASVSSNIAATDKPWYQRHRAALLHDAHSKPERTFRSAPKYGQPPFRPERTKLVEGDHRERDHFPLRGPYLTPASTATLVGKWPIATHTYTHAELTWPVRTIAHVRVRTIQEGYAPETPSSETRANRTEPVPATTPKPFPTENLLPRVGKTWPVRTIAHVRVRTIQEGYAPETPSSETRANRSEPVPATTPKPFPTENLLPRVGKIPHARDRTLWEKRARATADPLGPEWSQRWRVGSLDSTACFSIGDAVLFPQLAGVPFRADLGWHFGCIKGTGGLGRPFSSSVVTALRCM